MAHKHHLTAVVLYLTLATSGFATPTTIQFSTDSDLPYSEGGFTVSNVGSPPDVTPMRIVSGSLRSAGLVPDVDQHARVSSPTPFTLNALDYFVTFSSLTSPWRFESSAGAVVLPDHQGSPIQTIDFSVMPGWSNITYFDVIFEAPNARHSIAVDNVVVEFVPEPSALALGGISLVGLSLIRRRS